MALSFDDLDELMASLTEDEMEELAKVDPDVREEKSKANNFANFSCSFGKLDKTNSCTRS